jgi:CspA family cold shock protein
MVEGTVKFFNKSRNYGFISGDDGKSYFVHTDGLKEGVEIDEGDRVTFKAVEGDRGPKAEEVEKLKK